MKLPDIFFEAIERARRPDAGPNERMLAHIIDALLVLLILHEGQTVTHDDDICKMVL